MYEEDYTDGYKASMEELRKAPGFIEMDALCWHVFNTKDGQELLRIFKEKLICQATEVKISESYSTACVYMEGYRAAFRYLVEMVNAYQSRKDHEGKESQQQKG